MWMTKKNYFNFPRVYGWMVSWWLSGWYRSSSLPKIAQKEKGYIMSVFSSVEPGLATGGLHGLLLIAVTTAVSLPDLTLQWCILWKIHLEWDVEGPSLSLLLSVVSLFFFLYSPFSLSSPFFFCTPFSATMFSTGQDFLKWQPYDYFQKQIFHHTNIFGLLFINCKVLGWYRLVYYTEKNKGKATPDMVHNCVADLLDLPLEADRLRFPL